ncbi:hypothetical protein [Embleya sp. AB8]|uniref:hypothetical protein n=1 Tax=Embleya sp. AB8 TaxID=3156304 RepID=UPI003C73F1C5
MEPRTVERPYGAFHEPLNGPDVDAVFRRVFGERTRVTSAVELGAGMYNSTRHTVRRAFVKALAR